MRRSQSRVCDEVAEVLQLAGARHMVVGHNVQPGGVARSTCGGALHLMDSGISRAYGGNAAAWRCEGGTARAVHATDKEQCTMCSKGDVAAD